MKKYDKLKFILIDISLHQLFYRPKLIEYNPFQVSNSIHDDINNYQVIFLL